MKNKLNTLPTLLRSTRIALSLSCLAPWALNSGNEAKAAENSGETAIITLRDGSDPAAFAREHGLQPIYIYRHVINGFAAKLPAFHALIQTDSRVMRVEPDQTQAVQDSGASEEVQASGRLQSPPWGLDRLDQRSLPLDQRYHASTSGAGVTVYVVDTGIRYDHQEFEGRASLGYDAFKNGDGSDCNGHGTHVAGIIGGSAVGVAKSARLRSIRVLRCDGTGSTSSLLAGLDWVAGNHSGPSVLNYSIVGAPSAVLDEAMANLIRSGVIAVAAAGNNGGNACNYSPGRLPELITVGATDSEDRRWLASNTGRCVSVFAPGSKVISASTGGRSALRDMSGTSMAAPHTAGAAALYLERNPRATQEEVKTALLRQATHGAISDTKGSINALLYVGD